jgi:hypothetical protein
MDIGGGAFWEISGPWKAMKQVKGVPHGYRSNKFDYIFFFWAEENQPKCYRNPPEKAKKNVVRRGPPGPSRATFFLAFSGGHPCSIQRSLASLGTLLLILFISVIFLYFG